jgi:DNA-binding LacI/PurR family transcriptional regulator
MLLTITGSIQKRKTRSPNLGTMADRVTLLTIAAALGISRTTVSNAYNRPDQLSPARREEILAKARELGYAGPDPRGRGLRHGRVGAIGLIEKSLPAALSDPASLLMLGGVAEACDEAGVALVLIPRRTDGDLAHDVVRSAVVDGFVAHCDALDDERRTIVEERRLPIVVLDGRPAPDDPTVDIDEEGGASAAADHVLLLGHRRLAVVRFQPLTNGMFNSVADRRLAGYRAAAAAHGVDPSSMAVVDGVAYDRSEMIAVARSLLSRPDRPTAVLAMSDEMAVGVIAAARSLGLSVPGDLSVTGFDDTSTAVTSDPPLTTVHQPHADKGAAAVRMLLADGTGPRQVTFPVSLVVRSSTAPPPSAGAAP